MLEALAAVTEFATGAIDMMLMRESTHLSWVSTIVLVTAVVSEEILIALVRLQEAGRRVVLLALGDEPPPQLHVGGRYNSILIYHIPSNVPAFRAGHRSATATEAALSSIPTPEPVQLEVETVE